MIKKTITFNDFNDNVRTEDFYFHLNKAEIAKMEMSVQGGLAERIKRIVAAQDQPAIIEVFEELIQKAYGVKTSDGRGFIKKPEYLENFISTEAYSILFMELATDTEKASEFINGIIPADMAKELNAAAISSAT